MPLETEASRVCEFQTTLVPGLPQTADHTRAVCRTSAFRRTEENLDDMVRIRSIRQQRLTAAEDPLELVAIIDESVLHRPVGGGPVQRAQLEHLLIATGLDTVTPQVLSLSTEGHTGLDGSFSVLSFGELGEPDIGYVEHVNGAVHLEKEADVARATVAFSRLRSEAPFGSAVRKRSAGRLGTGDRAGGCSVV